MKVFNIALVAESMWPALNDLGLWGSILKSKYMFRLPLELWLCKNNHLHSTPSFLWRSFHISMSHINQDLGWKVGRGNCIYIGIDPMVGIERPFLYNLMLDWLHEKHFVSLQDIYVFINQHTPSWLSSSDLGLPLSLVPEWNAYVDALYNVGFILNTDRDEIV